MATATLEAAVVETESIEASSFSLFTDPDTHVVTKDFAFVFNRVLDPNSSPPKWRQLFHLVYQRSGGPQGGETHFGHAWSQDLSTWKVDTNAFAVDTTPWNSQHVWAPSIVQHGPSWLMFYTGVDASDDQRIGYVSAASLDTTNTAWSSARTKVWEAANTSWAVPDPSIYSGITQFRDPYVMEEPGNTGKLLLFYTAHDSIDFKANQPGLVVGIARSQTGTINLWDDLGYYPFTRRNTSGINQLEGPHVFPVNGTNSGWRLMFTSGGSPAGEIGSTTLRFFKKFLGSVVTDTVSSHWGSSTVVQTFLGGGNSVFGWSGSDEIHVADNIDYLAGFTAWGPTDQGIAISRMAWSDSNFTLASPSVTSVDEYRSQNAGIKLSLSGYAPHSRSVIFLIEAPHSTEARLDLYDVIGRHVKTLLHGNIRAEKALIAWDLSTSAGGTASNGVYFARLAFDGGNRTAKFPIVR